MAIRTLAASPLFKELQLGVLETLLTTLKPEHWARWSILMSPQQHADRFYLLIRGRVKLTRLNPKTAREITLFLLGPGAAFGFIHLADGLFRNICAETLDDVLALSGPAKLWEAWLTSYPVLRESVTVYIAGQLGQLAEIVGDLALHDTKTRLARLILRYLGTASGLADADKALIQDLPHEELAYMIGSVRVVVNRLLAELKREGVIDTQCGELLILSHEKLMRIAKFDTRGRV